MVIKSQKKNKACIIFFSVMHIDQREPLIKKSMYGVHVHFTHIYGPFLIGILELAQPRYMPLCMWERRSHKTVWCLAHWQLWTRWNIGAPAVWHISNPSSSTWLNKISFKNPFTRVTTSGSSQCLYGSNKSKGTTGKAFIFFF